MTVHFSSDNSKTAADGDLTADGLAVGFYSIAVLFNICLVVQVLSVGLAYFYHPQWWSVHVWLVRGYGGLSLLLAGWAFLMPLSARIQRLSASLPLLLLLQFLSIHLSTPVPLGVFHPLLAFVLFSVSTTLVHRARYWAFPDMTPTEM